MINKTAIQKLIEYFEQQLSLQRSSEIKYTTEEALVDAIDVCKNAQKTKEIEQSCINELSKEIYENNKAKGFYDDKKNIGEMLCLIHSEVSEALECDRKDKYADISLFDRIKTKLESYQEVKKINDAFEPFKQSFEDAIKDTFEDELADIMIRVMDLAAFKEIDLEWHIKAKMKYNSMRPHKHGKKY
jgi:NTP pyrophosphatase (non-canonical NTP hydrolase)